MKLTSFARQIAILLLVTTGVAHAVARPNHDHDDILGESDLLFGLKLGPELTGYTAVQTGSATIDVQSSMRALGGVALQFIYGLPRFELDLFWNARANMNTADTYNAVSVPILAKLPWEIDTGVDLEFGGGYEVDLVMFGAMPHRSTMTGVLALVGLSVDLGDNIFSFETRYNWGLETIADDVNGGRPRDVQILVGVGWHL